jgi:hypothetical protein
MRKQIGLLWIVGCFGLVAAADAQAPPSTAGAPFDGTYRFVSSARVNKTYVTRGGQMGQCPDRRAGPLTIAQGQAKYTSATGRQLEGTVGPQGELAMRLLAPPSSGGGYRPIEITVSGRVDGAGTVRARQESNSCSYDFIWQK